MSPPIARKPDSQTYAAVLRTPGGTEYPIPPLKPETQAMTAARQPAPPQRMEGVKLAIQILTLVALVIGVAEVAIALGRRDQSLADIREAFKESTSETSKILRRVEDIVVELGRQQAVIGTKVNNLEEWKKMLENRRNTP